MAATGALYCLAWEWLGLTYARYFLLLHTGSILGRAVGTIWPIVAGVLLLAHGVAGVLINGLTPPRLSQVIQRANPTARQLHKVVAVAAAPPVLLTVASGLLYRIMRRVFGFEKTRVSWIFSVHTMRRFGLGTVYPLAVGGLACWMAWLGLSILWQARARQQQRAAALASSGRISSSPSRKTTLDRLSDIGSTRV